MNNFLRMNTNEVQSKLLVLQRADRVLERTLHNVNKTTSESRTKTMKFIRQLLLQEDHGELTKQLIKGVFQRPEQQSYDEQQRQPIEIKF